jgi:hypothetical protein
MSELKQVTHWLIRVGDGKHLFTSAKFGIWGVDSTNSNVKSFMGLGNNNKNKKETSVNPGDILWFVKGGSGGLAIANAVFKEFVLREPGKTMSNSDLGWDISLNGSNGGWDYEVRFENFTDISEKKILTQIKAACPVRRYNPLCAADLPRLYESNVTLPEAPIAMSDSEKLSQLRAICTEPDFNLDKIMKILNNV